MEPIIGIETVEEVPQKAIAPLLRLNFREQNTKNSEITENTEIP